MAKNKQKSLFYTKNWWLNLKSCNMFVDSRASKYYDNFSWRFLRLNSIENYK